MGLLKTKVILIGGGPCDGGERILSNGQDLFLSARIHMCRDSTGALAIVQDVMCAHGYIRKDSKTFIYDGLRIIESEPPVPVEMRSFA